MQKSKLEDKTQKKKSPTKKPVIAKAKTKTLPQIKWYLLDASGLILGKVAAKAAKILLAKHDPSRKSYELPSYKVVVINAGKVAVTGRKEENKKYYRYSGYPGGLKERTLAQLREDRPEKIISHAIFGMLPKTKLGRKIQKNLYIYSGSAHPHEGQKPESIGV